MKKVFTYAIASIAMLLFWISLFAQDKQIKIEQKQNDLIGLYPCGKDQFYLAYGSSNIVNIMKYDIELNPEWSQVQVVKFRHIPQRRDVNIFTFRDSISGEVYSYLYGGGQIIQLLTKGTQKAKEIELPYKEIKDTAAIFVNQDGFNIITLNGENRYKSGSMNWITFSHETLKFSIKHLSLPLPPGIDKKNNSEWRILEVSKTGLYFYYVSCKDEKKDQTRPILVSHILKVNRSGTPGKIMSIDMGLKNYHAIPASYKIDIPTNLKIYNPDLLSVKKDYNDYTENSYVGIKLDEESDRIYTVMALNINTEDPKDTRTVDMFLEGSGIKTFAFTIFDLDGEKLSETFLKYTVLPYKRGALEKDYYYQTEISLQIPSDRSGMICKVKQHGNVTLYAVDLNGNLVSENTAAITTHNVLGTYFYLDLFSSEYQNFKDFDKSPYRIENSIVNNELNNLKWTEKLYVSYVNMNESDLLAYPINKENVILIKAYKKEK